MNGIPAHNGEIFLPAILKHYGYHTAISGRFFRHSLAGHLLEDVYDIRMVEELLGHQNVRSC